jgi:muconolactone delta-isomerase
MKRTAVLITLRLENVVGDFETLRQKELQLVANWQKADYLDSFYLRATRNGAMLIFKNLEEEKVKELVSSLPFFPFMDNVEYYGLDKQF